MASEAENLDKCFDVVSAIVQKAGDVIKHLFVYFFCVSKFMN